jgi:tripartite-type tricarboxylate transporter receptor subunit TctC
MHSSHSNRRDFLLRAVGTGAAIATAGVASAQNVFPSRPIRVVVPYAPGGGTDVIGRPLTVAMAADLGQPMFIENKPGAGTVIGSDAVAKAPPDGHTILMNSSAIAINAALVQKLPYDTERDLAPVARICQGPLVIACRPEKPWKTIADVIRAAKANPGKLSYASSGNGSAVHLGGELFKLMAQVDITHIPYRGAGPAYTDVLGGQVDLIFATAGGAHNFVHSGKMRAIAVTSAARSDGYPGVPAVAETIPGYFAEVWYAMLAPGGTPAPIVNRLNAALRRAANATAYRAALENEGLRVVADTPEETAEFMRSEIARWRKVVAEAHVKID